MATRERKRFIYHFNFKDALIYASLKKQKLLAQKYKHNSFISSHNFTDENKTL
jgi:hypothetical protein